MTQPTPDPIKAIKHLILTEARQAHNDVIVETGTRSGYSLRTLSQLDILLEAEAITHKQYQAGRIYWRLRDALTNCDNPLFRDVQGEHDEAEEAIEIDEFTIEDAQSFLAVVCKGLYPMSRKVLDAACAPAGGPKYIIMHAFGQGQIKLAFEMLEDAIPKAHEEMKNRLQRELKRVESAVESYV